MSDEYLGCFVCMEESGEIEWRVPISAPVLHFSFMLVFPIQLAVKWKV